MNSSEGTPSALFASVKVLCKTHILFSVCIIGYHWASLQNQPKPAKTRQIWFLNFLSRFVSHLTSASSGFMAWIATERWIRTQVRCKQVLLWNWLSKRKSTTRKFTSMTENRVSFLPSQHLLNNNNYGFPDTSYKRASADFSTEENCWACLLFLPSYERDQRVSSFWAQIFINEIFTPKWPNNVIFLLPSTGNESIGLDVAKR